MVSQTQGREMETPDDPYRVAPPGMLPEDWRDLANELDEDADQADADNDAEWLEERGL